MAEMKMGRFVQVGKAGGPLELVTREVAAAEAGWVRVRVQACGVCHSDSVTKEGLFPGIAYPRVPGHEVVYTTVAIARGADKAKFARELGATYYIDSTAEDVSAALQKLGGAKTILATVTDADAMSAAVGGLGHEGKFVVVGAPAAPLKVNVLPMLFARQSIAGWPSGAAIDSEDTLKFSAAMGVRPLIEKYPLEKAAEAYDRMMSGKARFRVVLETGN